MKKTSHFVIIMLISAILFSACTPVAPAENENETVLENENANTNANTNEDSNAEVEGAIEAMDGDMWTVAGKTVFVNPAVLGSTSFMIGDIVKIKAALNSDGTITAINVELLQSANANSNDANANDDNSNSSNTNANTNTNTNSNSNDDDD